MRVLSWNLLHGRDAPPGGLATWRSRLLRVTETSATHAQVNRSLLEEFATVLARDPWSVALLQEAPPRWLRPLCFRVGAAGASALTARNWLPGPRAWLAEQNPDLMASGEGGSNQLLVRPPWRLDAVRRLTLTHLPERRRAIWARLGGPGGGAVCVATLHATAGDEAAAARDVERAAERCVDWSGAHPLVLGGDLNLRPRSAGATFDRLSERFGLSGRGAPHGVDHVLVRGAEGAAQVRVLSPEWRELPHRGGRRLRLSDHDAVALEVRLPAEGPGRRSRPPAR